MEYSERWLLRKWPIRQVPPSQSLAPIVPLHRVKSADDLAQADSDDWRDWLREFESEPDTIEIVEIVCVGETFISKGWEGPDGRLYFSLITLRSIRPPDGGENLIHFTTREIAVDLSGEQSTLSAPTLLTRPGQAATIEIGDPGGGTRYRLDVAADPQPEAGAFLLNAKISRAIPLPNAAP